MTALLVVPEGFASSLSLFVMLATVVPISLAFAPQEVRRDKRVIVGLGLVVLAAIGTTASAAVTNICAYAWWAFECWFL